MQPHHARSFCFEIVLWLALQRAPGEAARLGNARSAVGSAAKLVGSAAKLVGTFVTLCHCHPMQGIWPVDCAPTSQRPLQFHQSRKAL